MHRVHQDEKLRGELMLEEIARQGARRMLAKALEAGSSSTSKLQEVSAMRAGTLWW
jgi:hypothetical protein